MEYQRGYYNQFKQYAFLWKPAFTQRQTDVYANENIPFVARPVEDPSGLTTAGGDRNLDTISTEDVVENFVNNDCDDDIDRYHYRNSQVSEFLEMGNMNVLRSLVPSVEVSRPMALLDDRNNGNVSRENMAGNLRLNLGHLSAHQLLRELRKHRTALQGHADAERRLIYVTDLDPFCAVTLAATASKKQAAFLRNFMYKYLACRALIGVEIPYIGFSTFSLEFHLPYRAWRRGAVGDLQDVRHLRRSEDVIHLEMNSRPIDDSDGLKDYIHEAQISVMVTGLDDWFWTAYCFVDVYFKDDYQIERVENCQPMDPHSGAKFRADRPLWNPREYFLRTLSCRMEQVKQEWNNAVFKLFRGIEPCIYSFTRGERDYAGATDLEITQQKGFRWTIRILREFTHLLSNTIDAWETFKDGEVRYFNLPDSEDLAQAAWGRYLAAIDKDVTELRDLRSSLIHRTELFENMTNSLVTHAAHAETLITRLQSEFIQALTVITILYLPATLASTIFSMQSSVLPSDAKLRDWIYTLIALFVMTFIIVINLSHIRKCGEGFRIWQDRMFNKLYKYSVIDSGLKAAFQRLRAEEENLTGEDIELEEDAAPVNQRIDEEA